MRFSSTIRAALAVLAVFLSLLAGQADVWSAPLQFSAEAPVNLTARQLSHDEESQVVTALGDVELVQGEKILRADKVAYNLGTDTVTAIGNVSLLDEDGSVHFAEYVQLSGNMKDGFVHQLLSLLADGSRFTAAEARRENGTKITMTDASYTPCKVCEENPEPVWQIKADKVVHDEVEKTVKYKNARLEMLGVPLAFTPVFSHADPSVKRKSGFIRPQYGWTDDVGTYVQGGYYFGDIAPDMDATLQVRPTTLAGTLLQGQWRQRFEDGRIQVDASGARSDRTEENGQVDQNRWRGHVFADGQFDLNDKWRAGFGVERASDKGYLRLYDLSRKDVLESEAYAERFSGRDYSRVGVLDFQDVRLGIRPDQPAVLPQAEHRMTGAPGGTLGGRWTAGVSALSLQRGGQDQDMQRASVDAGWERRDITASGIALQLGLSGRGDFYAVQDSDAAALNPALDANTQTVRGAAVAGVTASYPLVKRLQKSQAVIEPLIGASFSPQVDDDDTDIPNEDSIDVQLDTNNLFSDSRFPGIDRQEDGARVNYGLKSGVYADSGRFGKAFIGQSYRFDEDDIFPQGSGLEDKASDIVGQINVGLSRYLNADYRFQLDNRNLSAHRHEIQASGGNERFDLDLGYLYIDGIAGTGFTEAREQVQVGGDYRLNERWWLNASTLTDLGEEPGLRKGSLGLNYADECFSFALQGTRNLLREASGESGTVILMRFGFKNIGEFSTPHVRLKGRQQEE